MIWYISYASYSKSLSAITEIFSRAKSRFGIIVIGLSNPPAKAMNSSCANIIYSSQLLGYLFKNKFSQLDTLLRGSAFLS